MVSKDLPSALLQDRGVRQEIDLEPGTKYCTTRQWPMPKGQVNANDAFFVAKHEASMVRDSKSPHSLPTFCAKFSTAKWSTLHTFNKLTAITIPASTLILCKDLLLKSMAGGSTFSALDNRRVLTTSLSTARLKDARRMLRCLLIRQS